MTLCHTHRRENPFTQIDKSIAFNKNLSLQAKGLLLIAFSRPEDWSFYKDELMSHSSNGRHSFETITKELEKHGYLHREKKVDPETKRFTGWEWHFYEQPISTEEFKKSFRNTGFPSIGNSDNRETSPYRYRYKEIKKEKEKDTQEKKPKPIPVPVPKSEEDYAATPSGRLCVFLFSFLKKFDPRLMPTDFAKEVAAMERFRAESGLSDAEIEDVIKFIHNSDFWASRIRSVASLAKSHINILAQLKIAPRASKCEIEASKKIEAERYSKQLEEKYEKAGKPIGRFMSIHADKVMIRTAEGWGNLFFADHAFKEQLHHHLSKIEALDH